MLNSRPSKVFARKSIVGDSQTVTSRRNSIIVFTVVILFGLGISQLSSYLIDSYLAIEETYVVNSIIHITHIRNFGGIFGSLQGMGWIFGVLATLLLTGLVIYIVRSKDLQPYEYICFGLIIGGGASNILDRVLRGSVVDFSNIQHIPYWHYIFNTADVLIHLGAWPMVVLTFLLAKQESSKTEA